LGLSERVKEQIGALQDNLGIIRKLAGWTVEELGDRIGVTKQTISNLENRKTEMSLPQYIAIRSAIQYEIETNPENEVLAYAVALLLDKREEMAVEEHEQVRHAFHTTAAAASGGLAGAALFALLTTLLGPFRGAGLVAGVVGGAGGWLYNLYAYKGKRDRKKRKEDR
jgi:transcriptional regulator with XRE-family HTH domain